MTLRRVKSHPVPPAASARFAIAVAIAGALSAGAAADPVLRRIVALSGTDGPLGPGLGPGVAFAPFDGHFPGVDELGGVAFVGTLTGAGVTDSNNSAIYHERDGERTIVAREGLSAKANGAGVYIDGIPPRSMALSRDGRVTIVARVQRPTPPHRIDSLWTEDGAGLTLVAWQGQVVPDAPGVPPGATFAELGNPAAGLGGEFAFYATLAAPDGRELRSLWAWRGGALRPIACATQTWPEPGWTLDDLGAGYGPEVSINAHGRTAFLASINGAGGDEVPGAFFEEGGDLTLAAAWGDPAPGTLPGATITAIGITPTINDAGDLAIHGYLDVPGASGFDAWAIWRTSGGLLDLVVHSGEPMPGLAPGAFLTYAGTPAIDRMGRLAFWGFDYPNGVQGIWSFASGPIRNIAVTTRPPPGCPAGVVMTAISSPFLNNRGHIAYIARLSLAVGEQSATFGHNDAGAFVADESGRTVALFRVGQPLEVAPGDVRWIENIAIFPNGLAPESGWARPFNDLSMFACRLIFTDGSGAMAVAQPLSFCPADIDGDGVVGFHDLNRLAAAFNTAVGEPGYDFEADLDLDGEVDFADMNLVLASYHVDC